MVYNRVSHFGLRTDGTTYMIHWSHLDVTKFLEEVKITLLSATKSTTITHNQPQYKQYIYHLNLIRTGNHSIPLPCDNRTAKAQFVF